MKKTLSLFVLILMGLQMFAQVPQKFTYQAVVRNENNTLVHGTVGVRISILQGGTNGTLVYQETHTVVTNVNGLMTFQVGGGTVLNGDFASINWADGTYFLKTETDPTGGTNYTIEGTQQLLSVPYALYAGSSANSFSGDYNDLINTPTIPIVPTTVSAFNNDAGYITMDSVPTIPTNVGAFINDVGYITMDSIPVIPAVPTNVSAFNNDVNYITAAQVPAQVNADWNATSGVAQILNKPSIPTVPTDVSAFNNDVHYITNVQLQDILSGIYYTIDSLQAVIADINLHLNPTLGVVTTGTTSEISYTTATCSGNVISDGGTNILAVGICYSTSNTPTLADNVTVDSYTSGPFTSTLTGLTAGTTYYVRAYVTNELGTAYGEVQSFTTAGYTVPIVTTTTASNISSSSATSGGNVTDDGGTEVTARGVCWSTSHNPTTSNSTTTNGTGTGSFTSSLTGLSGGTTYYVRAYATNNEGTSYGNEISFNTTTPTPTLPTPNVSVERNGNNFYFTISTPGVSGVKYYVQTYAGNSWTCSNTNDPSSTNYNFCPTGQGTNSVATCSYNLLYPVLIIKFIGTKSGYNSSSVRCYQGNWQ